VVYCSVLKEWRLAASQAFERKTGVKVILNVKGSGEVGA